MNAEAHASVGLSTECLHANLREMRIVGAESAAHPASVMLVPIFDDIHARICCECNEHSSCKRRFGAHGC